MEYFDIAFNKNTTEMMACPFQAGGCTPMCALYMVRRDEKKELAACAFTVIAFAVNKMRNTSEGL